MPIIMTEIQLLEKLKICKPTLYSMRKRGMPCIKVGNRLIRYDFADVIEWLKNNDPLSERRGG